MVSENSDLHNPQKRRQKQAKTLRTFRKIHKVTATLTFIVIFIVAVTGIVLAWKKHSGNAIQPKTQRGTATEAAAWLSLDSLQTLGLAALTKHDASLSPELDRMDVRPDKGIVKFVFTQHYWEVQLDCATGETLYVGRRYSDLFEQIHDGSIVDRLLGIKGDWFKLSFSNLTGWSLVLFTITGVWLWLGPIWMRKQR